MKSLRKQNVKFKLDDEDFDKISKLDLLVYKDHTRNRSYLKSQQRGKIVSVAKIIKPDLRGRIIYLDGDTTNLCKNNISNTDLFAIKYRELKGGAKARNVPLKISRPEYIALIQNNPNCHYCGDSILKFKGSSLDRKNNNKGYTLTNVVTCCPSCNTIKSDILTYDEMKFIMEKLLEYRKNKIDKTNS